MAFTYSYNGNTYGSSQGDTSKEEKKTGGFSYSYNGETHQSQPAPATNTSINLNPIASAITTPAKAVLDTVENPADILAQTAISRRKQNAAPVTRNELRAEGMEWTPAKTITPEPVKTPQAPNPIVGIGDFGTTNNIENALINAAPTAIARGQGLNPVTPFDVKTQNEQDKNRYDELNKQIQDYDLALGMADTEATQAEAKQKRDALVAERQQLMQEHPEFVNADKAQGNAFLGSILSGSDQAVGGLTGFVDSLVGDFAQDVWSMIGLGSYDNPITALNKYVQKEKARNTAYFSEKVKGDPTAEKIYNYGTQTVAAVPAAVLAYMTAGGSAATTAGLEATAYMNSLAPAQQTLYQVSNAVSTMMADPNFSLSFAQEAGNAYQSALDEGMSESDAAVYSLLYGYLSAVVEVGGTSEIAGGLQQYAKDVQKPGGMAKGLLDYAKNITGEISEEVIQGALERGTKSLFGVNTAVYSNDQDQNAIIKPNEMAEEAKGAAIVSTLLGIPGAVTRANVNSQQQTEEITPTDVNPAPEPQTAFPAMETAPAVTEEITQDNVNPVQETTAVSPETAPQEITSTEEKTVDGMPSRDRAAIEAEIDKVTDELWKLHWREDFYTLSRFDENGNRIWHGTDGSEVGDDVVLARSARINELEQRYNQLVEAISEVDRGDATTVPVETAENIPESMVPAVEAVEPSVAGQETGVATIGSDVGGSTVTEPVPRMKRSQTESNTMQGVASVFGGQQEELYYIPKSERQTLMTAASRVRADISGEMTRLMDQNLWTAEDVDTALTIYGMLQADAVRSRDFSAAQAWAKVIQPRGTAGAQALQAFSKWTRSGQGAMDNAIQELADSNLPQPRQNEILSDMQGFADDYDSLTDSDVDGLRSLIKRLSDYRGTGTIFRSNFGKILDQVTDGAWLREYALRQLMAIPSDYTAKPTLAQMLKTWQVNSQLSRLGTFFRNIGGNLVFGVQDTLAQNAFGYAIDSLISKSTGTREVGLDKSWLSSNARKGSRDAMLKSILEVAGDVDMTGEATRYGNTSSRTFKMAGNGFSRFMSRWEQLLGYSLTTSDRTSRGQIETAVEEGINDANRSLYYSRMAQEAMDALAGRESRQRRLANRDQARAAAQSISEDTADYRLFQNESVATGVSRGIHDALNAVGIGGQLDRTGRHGGFGLGDLVNAYPGVPANLAVKAFEYSPANIIKGGVEVIKLLSDYHNGVNVEAGRQNKAAMDIARGMSGVPAIALLAALFKCGAAKNADDEEDADVSAQKSAEGRTGVQLNLSATKRLLKGESGEWKNGDDLMSIGWLEPLNAFMAIASMVAEEDDDITVGSVTKDYLYGAIQSVLDMPVMSNISNIVDTFRYSTAESLPEKAGEAALQFAGDAASGMLPAPLFSQLAKATDDTYRATKGDTAAQTVLNGILANIPGLRQTLPAKLDNFGEEKKYTGSDFTRFLNTYVLPGSINEMTQSEISGMVEKVYEDTGDPAAYPDRKAPNSIKINGETVKLTQDQQRDYQRITGEHIREYLDDAMNSNAFDRLSAEDRVSVMKDIYGYSEYLAKKSFADDEYKSSKYTKYDELSDPVEGIILDHNWHKANGEEKDYKAIDRIISSMGSLKEDTADLLRDKTDADKLEAAREEGIKSEAYYDIHDMASALSKAATEIKKTGNDTRDYSAIDALIDTVYNEQVTTEDAKDIFTNTYAWLDELGEASKIDINSKAWFKFKDEYDRVNAMDMSNNDKYNTFMKFVDDSKLTDEQKALIKDQLRFRNTMTIGDTRYDKMVTNGMDTETALRYATEMNALEPLAGEAQVSTWQRAEVILSDASLTPQERLVAFDQSGIVPSQKDFARWLSQNVSTAEAHRYWQIIGEKNTPKPWTKTYEQALKSK